MRTQPQSLGHRGVSPIVAEMLLIAVVTMAMAVIAAVVISGVATRERLLELRVRLENASPPDPDGDNTFDSFKVVLFHIEGDALGIPRRADDEFRVGGYKIGENTWENTVPWDNWVFSSEANGFQHGENAVGYFRHDRARIHIEDAIKIVVTDLKSNQIIYLQSVTVENSDLYV